MSSRFEVDYINSTVKLQKEDLTGTVNFNIEGFTTNQVITVPETTDTLVCLKTIDILENKTLKEAKFDILKDTLGNNLIDASTNNLEVTSVNNMTLTSAVDLGISSTNNMTLTSAANLGISSATDMLITSAKKIEISTGTTTDDLVINSGSGTGRITLDNVKWPKTDGLADQVLKTDGQGSLSYAYADIFEVKTGTTSDSAYHTIADITTDDNSTYFIESYIVGIYSDSTKSAAYKMNSIYRNNGTTATKITTNDNKTCFEESGETFCDAKTEIDITNNKKVLIQVRGNGSQVVWKASYKVLSIKTTETPLPLPLP